MVALQVIGLFLALFLLAFMVAKGLHIYIASIAATVILIVTNSLGVVDSMTAYTAGVADFVGKYILYFFAGAIFGAVMDATGSARKIGGWLLNAIGTKGAVFAVMLASSLLTIGGITGYVLVLVVYPIAINMFRGAKLPPAILPAVIGAGTTVGVGFLPYSTSVNNMIPTEYLGTTIASGALYGCIGAVVVYVFCLLYFKYAVKKITKGTMSLSDEQMGQMYAIYDKEEPLSQEAELPSLACAGIPMIISVGLAIVLVNVTSWTSLNCVLLSVFIAIIACMLLNRKHLKAPNKTVAKGVENAISICLITAAVMGFGNAVTITPGYTEIANFITSIDMNPYFTAIVATSLMAAVTANSVGGIRMSMQTFGDFFVASGANLGAIHKITVISGLGLNTMPHSGSTLSQLKTCKVTFKDGFMHVFITSGLIPLLGSIIIAVVAMIVAPV